LNRVKSQYSAMKSHDDTRALCYDRTLGELEDLKFVRKVELSNHVQAPHTKIVNKIVR